MKHVAYERLVAQAPSLETAVAAVGFHNWSQPAIDRYMKAEARKLRPNALYWIAKSIPLYRVTNLADRIEIVIGALLLLSTIVCSGAFIIALVTSVHGMFIGDGSPPPVATVTLITGFFSLAFLIASIALVVRYPLDEYAVYGWGEWSTMPFEGFAVAYAPAHVEKKVEVLRHMLPNARFEISILMHKNWPFDPVLWLIHGNERRPVFVWDQDGKTVLPPQ